MVESITDVNDYKWSIYIDPPASYIFVLQRIYIVIISVGIFFAGTYFLIDEFFANIIGAIIFLSSVSALGILSKNVQGKYLHFHINNIGIYVDKKELSYTQINKTEVMNILTPLTLPYKDWNLALKKGEQLLKIGEANLHFTDQKNRQKAISALLYYLSK